MRNEHQYRSGRGAHAEPTPHRGYESVLESTHFPFSKELYMTPLRKRMIEERRDDHQHDQATRPRGRGDHWRERGKHDDE